MPPNPRRLKRLKLFFWIVWGFNLFNCGVYGFDSYQNFTTGRWSTQDDTLFFILCFALILFSGLFVYMGQLLVRNYFPDKELVRWKRRGYNVLGTVQILCALAEGLMAGILFFVVIPSQPKATVYEKLRPALWGASSAAASVCNIPAAVVVWRTMRAIRRNFEIGLLESFESVP